METMDDDRRLRKARGIVLLRVRLYFAYMKAALDADTEGFFQRVIQQADRRVTPSSDNL